MCRIFRFVLPVFLLAACFVSLPGCGGGGAKSVQTTNTTTKGQELLDLKKAFDSGIITEREYNNQKEEILDE